MRHYAVDLDGVLFDSNAALLDAMNRRFGTAYRLADMRAWDWSEWCSDEHTRHAWSSFAGLVETGLPLLPGAREGLARLASTGSRLTVVTHRTADLVALTATALAGLPCTAIHHVDPAMPKAILARELGCTVALDDSPDQAQAYAEAGLQVYLFSYPYNAHIQHPLVRHVRGWADVLTAEVGTPTSLVDCTAS